MCESIRGRPEVMLCGIPWETHGVRGPGVPEQAVPRAWPRLTLGGRDCGQRGWREAGERWRDAEGPEVDRRLQAGVVLAGQPLTSSPRSHVVSVRPSEAGLASQNRRAGCQCGGVDGGGCTTSCVKGRSES